MLLKCFLSVTCYNRHKGYKIDYNSILAQKEPIDRQGREMCISYTVTRPYKRDLHPKLGGKRDQKRLLERGETQAKL